MTTKISPKLLDELITEVVVAHSAAVLSMLKDGQPAPGDISYSEKYGHYMALEDMLSSLLDAWANGNVWTAEQQRNELRGDATAWREEVEYLRQVHIPKCKKPESVAEYTASADTYSVYAGKLEALLATE